MDRQEKVAAYYKRLHAGYSLTRVKYLFNARTVVYGLKSLQSGQHSSFNSGFTFKIKYLKERNGI